MSCIPSVPQPVEANKTRKALVQLNVAGGLIA